MQGARFAGGTLCREWSDATRCSENDSDRQYMVVQHTRQESRKDIVKTDIKTLERTIIN
jgi:hypothetical protein